MTDAALFVDPTPAGPRDAYDNQPALTPVERVSNTFFAPTKTFADLRRNPSWWLPFVLLALFGYVFSLTALNHVGATRLAEASIHNNPTQRERVEAQAPEQRAQTIRITAAIMQGSLLATPLFVLVFCAVGALLLWVGFNFILGGSATYGGMFAVTMFAWLPSLLRSLLSAGMLFAGDPENFNINDPVGTNPGFYMGADSSAFLKSVLSSVDLFSLWMLALMAIGGAIVARVKVKNGLVLVFTAWLLFVLLKAAAVAAMS